MINAMPHYDFRTPRVYIAASLAGGETVAFDRGQTNYLRNVLRLKDGDAVLLFNGRDGEWQARARRRRQARPRGGGRAAPARTAAAL